MNTASAHVVAHRRSLAYRVFINAAQARDVWLGNENVGDFSATVQKYYTGISLKRYLVLVCIEYPIVLLTSALAWMAGPGVLLYMVYRVFEHAEEIGAWGLLFFFGSIVTSAAVAGVAFILWMGIVGWAEKGPGFIARWYHTRFADCYDEDYNAAKYPGPMALLKKWLISSVSETPSQITWDSGKRQRREEMEL